MALIEETVPRHLRFSNKDDLLTFLSNIESPIGYQQLAEIYIAVIHVIITTGYFYYRVQVDSADLDTILEYIIAGNSKYVVDATIMNARLLGESVEKIVRSMLL